MTLYAFTCAVIVRFHAARCITKETYEMRLTLKIMTKTLVICGFVH